MKINRHIGLVCAALVLICALQMHAQSTPAPATGILHPSDLTSILPSAVFFRGQSAPTQLRNSGGVRFPGGLMMMTTLVDSSGYSSGIQEKYQAYLVTEVPLDFAGHTLQPGAYGAGIIRSGNDLQFVVMDIAAKDVLQVSASHDAKIHRPVPLQILPGNEAGVYRLYLGRNYVDFKRVN